MSQVEALLSRYESGRLSRRELVAILTAAVVAPRTVAAQPVLEAATLNHASLIVSDLERSVAFYQRTFGLAVKSTPATSAPTIGWTSTARRTARWSRARRAR